MGDKFVFFLDNRKFICTFYHVIYVYAISYAIEDDCSFLMDVVKIFSYGTYTIIKCNYLKVNFELFHLEPGKSVKC